MAKKNNFNSKKYKNIYKRLVLFFIIVLAVLASFIFAINNKNIIYDEKDIISFSDFTVTITSVEIKKVDLPILDSVVDAYGGIDNNENCELFSSNYRSTWSFTGEIKNQYAASERNVCVRRNNSRDIIKKYTEENRQLVVNYRIKSKGLVKTNNFQISIIPDSGRNPNMRVNEFNGNEFMVENFKYINNKLYYYGETYNYTPYFYSDLGLDINIDITRDAFIYTDVRISEKTADVIFNYEGTSKILRVNLK